VSKSKSIDGHSEPVSETDIMRQIHSHLGIREDIRLFRNNVGVAKMANGSYLKYGLATGSADLIGWKSRVITQADVGKTIAQFLSIEVKTPTGVVASHQKKWQEIVNRMGGIGIITCDKEVVV
jgi:hypothetical protein